MKVVVKTYQPNVVCVGQTISSDIREPCQSLLDTMATDETAITFGVTRDSTVRTPYSRVSCEHSCTSIRPFFLKSVIADGLCVMEINTSGVLSDVASWRDFWEVGVALNGVCIRKGREGFQINIGNHMLSHLLQYWYLTCCIGATKSLHMELKDNRNSKGTFSFS